MNVLVVAPAWIGDMVIAQSLLRLIAQRLPDARIDVLAPRATAALTERMPEVANTHTVGFGHGELAFFARRALGRQLRGRFDWAIVLPNSWKSALVPFFAQVPRRTGFVGEGRYGLLNDLRPAAGARLTRLVQRFAALGPDQAGGDPPPPRLAAPPAAAARVRERLGVTGDRPVLALCPGAEYGAAKRWPPGYFAQVAKRHLRDGFHVWILGGAADVAIARDIANEVTGGTVSEVAVETAHEGSGRTAHEASGKTAQEASGKTAHEVAGRTAHVVVGKATNKVAGGGGAGDAGNLFDLTGRTTLLEAVDLLSAAARVVSNDSGLMHVAAALGVPVVGIYGSSSPVFTPPLAARAASVSLALRCSPCFARTCRYGHYDCLRKLAPELVLSALARVTDGA